MHRLILLLIRSSPGISNRAKAVSRPNYLDVPVLLVTHDGQNFSNVLRKENALSGVLDVLRPVLSVRIGTLLLGFKNILH